MNQVANCDVTRVGLKKDVAKRHVRSQHRVSQAGTYGGWEGNGSVPEPPARKTQPLLPLHPSSYPRSGTPHTRASARCHDQRVHSEAIVCIVRGYDFQLLRVAKRCCSNWARCLVRLRTLNKGYCRSAGEGTAVRGLDNDAGNRRWPPLRRAHDGPGRDIFFIYSG